MAAKKSPRKNSKKKKVTEVVAVEAAIIEERPEGEVELTPQQTLFLQLYYDRESPTWGNAKQSALSAGYDYNYANQITYKKPKWWLGFVRQQNMSDLIEQHFAEVMTLPTITQAMGAFGPLTTTETIKEDTGQVYKTGKKKGEKKFKNKRVKVPVMVPNMNVIKEKTAIAKIAAPAHNPDMYGRKNLGSGNKFTFNMGPDREKYA